MKGWFSVKNRCENDTQSNNIMSSKVPLVKLTETMSLLIYLCGCWRDRVEPLATDPVVMRSSPDTRHIPYALLVNQPEYFKSTIMRVCI